MAKGGKRPGAGRKPGVKASHTIASENARAYAIQRITKELDPILTAQIEAAKGMYVETDKKIVYQKSPDLKAGEFLLNQNIGRPKETMEVQGEMRLKLDV